MRIFIYEGEIISSNSIVTHIIFCWKIIICHIKAVSIRKKILCKLSFWNALKITTDCLEDVKTLETELQWEMVVVIYKVCRSWSQNMHKNTGMVLLESEHEKLVETIMTWQPVSHVYETSSNPRDKYKHMTESTETWNLPAVTPERPISFKEGPAPTPNPLPLTTELLSVQWIGEWRSEAITERQEVELIGQLLASIEALLPNLRAQRHREVLFTLYSWFFSRVQFSWVQSCCNQLVPCLYRWSHFIFTIIIEIYRVVVFMLWSPPDLGPVCPQ